MILFLFKYIKIPPNIPLYMWLWVVVPHLWLRVNTPTRPSRGRYPPSLSFAWQLQHVVVGIWIVSNGAVPKVPMNPLPLLIPYLIPDQSLYPLCAKVHILYLILLLHSITYTGLKFILILWNKRKIIIWRPPSLSKLTPYKISSGLTHLGTEAPIYENFHWLY